MRISKETNFSAFELDELFWFLKRKGKTKTRENIYIMTMMSRIPRQILGFTVDNSVKSSMLQEMVDSVPAADEYCTDGCLTYLDVILGGKHTRNVRNKKDTHNIESANADIRHYVPGGSQGEADVFIEARRHNNANSHSLGHVKRMKKVPAIIR